MRRKSDGKKATYLVIILVIVAIAIVPVLRSLLPSEIARWHLAAAMNAYQRKDDVAANEYVHRARRWDSDIESDIHYWNLRYLQVPETEPDQQLELYLLAAQKAPKFRALGPRFAEELAEHGHFSQAVKMLEFAFANRKVLNAENWNNLAYFRALAASNLDQALDEINRALEFEQDEVSFRDTRAWVYFQMGRLSEALVDADFAVQQILDKLDKRLLLPTQIEKLATKSPNAKDSSGKLKQTKPEQQNAGTESNSEGKDATNEVVDVAQPLTLDKSITQTPQGSLLWAVGVMIYHRAKILEALGRQDDADRDYQWLRERRLPVDGQLY